MSDDEDVYYAGVKGMKWGVRKDRPGGPGYSERKTKAKNKKRKKDPNRDLKRELDRERIKSKIEAERKKRETVSKEDLKSSVERLRLEREYKKLTAKEHSAGRQFMNDVLKTAGRAAATAFVAAAITKGLNQGSSKIFDTAKNAKTGKFNTKLRPTPSSNRPKSTKIKFDRDVGKFFDVTTGTTYDLYTRVNR